MIETWRILLSLSITLAFETFIYLFIKAFDLKLYISVVAMNLVLNVAMNLILLIVGTNGYYLTLILSEINTIAIESLIIFAINKVKYPKCLLFSFLANVTSMLVGIIFWPFENEKMTVIVLTIIFASVFLAVSAYFVIKYAIKKSRETI